MKIFKMPSILITLASVSILSGCSVYKAASNDGIAVSDIKKCTHKGCLLAKGMEKIETLPQKNGEVFEVFRAKARKSGVNYFRAAGHGVLDVMTLGLWEVAGTPLEGAISNNRGYIIAKATFANKDTDVIKSLEIYDANGKKVQ